MVLSKVFGAIFQVRYTVLALIHALLTSKGFVPPRRNPFLCSPTIARRFVLESLPTRRHESNITASYHLIPGTTVSCLLSTFGTLPFTSCSAMIFLF